MLPGMQVAVKRLFPSLYGHDQDVEDFVREGTLLASLHHPCVLCVLIYCGSATVAAHSHICKL